VGADLVTFHFDWFSCTFLSAGLPEATQKTKQATDGRMDGWN
jgi:hypothetical protein